MTWLSKNLPGILIVISVMLLVSCAGNEAPEKMETDLVPPSLETSEPGTEIVNLTDKQASELNIRTIKIEKMKIDYKISCPGNVFPASDRIGILSAPLSGRITAIYAHEGDFVRKGDVLAEIESLEFINMIYNYINAVKDYEYRLNELKRLKKLAERNISSKSEMDNNKYLLSKTGGEVKIGFAKLKALGLSAKEIESWENKACDEETDIVELLNTETKSALKIRSAVTGYINEHYIDMGQSINIYDKMLTVIGTDKVMIKGFLSPSDAFLVNTGDKVIVSTKNDPGKIINGVVHSMNPALDDVNKSININILVNTIKEWPKPGQNVRLEIDASTASEVVSVPMDAIVFEEDNTVVFVKLSLNEYEKRYLKIIRMAGDKAIIGQGLLGGEEVAVSQVFSLKAMAKFKEYAEE